MNAAEIAFSYWTDFPYLGWNTAILFFELFFPLFHFIFVLLIFCVHYRIVHCHLYSSCETQSEIAKTKQFRSVVVVYCAELHLNGKHRTEQFSRDVPFITFSNSNIQSKYLAPINVMCQFHSLKWVRLMAYNTIESCVLLRFLHFIGTPPHFIPGR